VFEWARATQRCPRLQAWRPGPRERRRSRRYHRRHQRRPLAACRLCTGAIKCANRCSEQCKRAFPQRSMSTALLPMLQKDRCPKAKVWRRRVDSGRGNWAVPPLLTFVVHDVWGRGVSCSARACLESSVALLTRGDVGAAPWLRPFERKIVSSWVVSFGNDRQACSATPAGGPDRIYSLMRSTAACGRVRPWPDWTPESGGLVLSV
jgi:hypothetical protein